MYVSPVYMTAMHGPSVVAYCPLLNNITLSRNCNWKEATIITLFCTVVLQC